MEPERYCRHPGGGVSTESTTWGMGRPLEAALPVRGITSGLLGRRGKGSGEVGPRRTSGSVPARTWMLLTGGGYGWRESSKSHSLFH